MAVAEELRVLAVRHRWAFEELTLDQKMKEWNWHTSARVMVGWQEDRLRELKLAEAIKLFETVGGMFNYLQETFGSTKRVLYSLRVLVSRQSGRRKTMCLK